LRDDILATLLMLAPHAEALGSTGALLHLAEVAGGGDANLGGDAQFLRAEYARQGSAEGMVDAAIRRFRAPA
jgi:carboxylate-amine ligase